MGDGEISVRWIDCAAGALWVVTLALIISSWGEDSQMLGRLGLVASAAAATVTVAAVVTCAVTKMIREIRETQYGQLRQMTRR